MQSQATNTIFLIVVSALIFFALAAFIAIFVIRYQRKQLDFRKSTQRRESEFKNELLCTQLEIQELTFNYISQEIHDNVGQILSLAKVQLNILQASHGPGGDMFRAVKENISKALADLRDISKSLSSERIRSLQIEDAVNEERDRINKSGISNVQVITRGETREIDSQKRLIIFRIIQESLQNSIKYASASDIVISLDYLPDCFLVRIADNGKGFDTKVAFRSSNGLGLMNIRTRAALSNGSSQIESILNKGTTITITIPYE
jgi:two-component system NarL family sensor kinase